MSKLLKLKKYLTLDEAVIHLTGALDSPVTKADLYRFCIDGHLILSTVFLHHPAGLPAIVIDEKDLKHTLVELCPLSGKKLDKPYYRATNYEEPYSEGKWIRFEFEPIKLAGIWDLSMIGAAGIDIERYYQLETTQQNVDLSCMMGILLQQNEVICQLQSVYTDPEIESGSFSSERDLEEKIELMNYDDIKAEKLRADFRVKREKYLEYRRNYNGPKYYPSDSIFEHPHTLVIKISELTRFISLLNEPEPKEQSQKQLESKERNTLLTLIAVLCNEAKIDINKRGISSSIAKMTELFETRISDDTIRNIIKQIPDAIERKQK